MSAVAPRQSGSRFAALDGARALAAYAVIGTHVGFNTGRTQAPGILGPILARLDIGVTVFFLLSGFLLYRPFAQHSVGAGPRPSIRLFLWRRGVRIFPALWVFVIITLAWITTYTVHPTDFAHYLLLIQIYDHHDYDPNLTHLWTLSVELTFYAMLPVFARLIANPRNGPAAAVRRQFIGMAGLAAVALVFNVVQGQTSLTNSQALLWLPAYLDWFALGMFLALMSCIPPELNVLRKARQTVLEWAGSLGTCWLVAGLSFMIATLPVGVPYTLAPALWWQWTIQHYLFGVTALFFLLPLVLGNARSNGIAGRALGSPIARELANISYAVYLWHVPIMLLLQRELGYESFTGHFWTILAVTVVATTVVASASWHLLEQPILRHASRGWRGSSGAETAATATAATQIS